MSSDNQDFQFELNETLYFDRGYEVLELLGISLNPDITIHSYDTYVSIRGKIELRGEYIREEILEEREEKPISFDDFEAKRYVEQVKSSDGNIAEFLHYFPVDISVPTYRVENLEDVEISIITFDYEFPMNSKLELSAVAEIQGIKADTASERIEAEETKEEPLHSFAFEVTREERPSGEKEENTEATREMEPAAVEPEAEKEEQSDLFSDELEDDSMEQEEEATLENELTIRAMEYDELDSEEEEKEEIKDVSYLTDIFRSDDEENYTKMRICIVQEEDTIESIAERFQVSALQLIKQNKLDDDFDISEGQLLYIPKK